MKRNIKNIEKLDLLKKDLSELQRMSNENMNKIDSIILQLEELVRNMKEVNMEQDIEILEEMLKTRKEQKEIIECAGGYCGNCNPDIKALENAIQTMRAYKELEEENTVLKKANNISENVTVKDITNFMNKSLKDFKKEYIPVSLVEEKIEELNEYYKKEIYPSLISWSDVDITEYYDGMIGILQELLEKRK